MENLGKVITHREEGSGECNHGFKSEMGRNATPLLAVWSGLPPEDTSLEGPRVLTANEAVRSFQIAVALKLQRAHCPSGNVLCQGLGEERSRHLRPACRMPWAVCPQGWKHCECVARQVAPGRACGKALRTSLSVASRVSSALLGTCAGAACGTCPPRLRAGAVYVLLHLTFIGWGPVVLGRCLV